jgi:hypothetical protein
MARMTLSEGSLLQFIPKNQQQENSAYPQFILVVKKNFESCNAVSVYMCYI